MFNKFISSSLVKISARYGAIAGVLCIIFLITFTYMGKSPLLIDPYMDFRVLMFAVLIFFCLKEIRDFYQGGMLAMWEGMVASLMFLAVSGGIAVIGILVFGTIEPKFLSDYISQLTAQIKDLPEEAVKQIGKDVLDRNLKALPGTNLWSLATTYLWQTFVIGFFISVIISVILRRQPKRELT